MALTLAFHLDEIIIKSFYDWVDLLQVISTFRFKLNLVLKSSNGTISFSQMKSIYVIFIHIAVYCIYSDYHFAQKYLMQKVSQPYHALYLRQHPYVSPLGTVGLSCFCGVLQYFSHCSRSNFNFHLPSLTTLLNLTLCLLHLFQGYYIFAKSNK